MRIEVEKMGLFTQKKRAKVFFDIIADFYNYLNPKIYTNEMREYLRKNIEGSMVLDVGVGTGYSTKHMKAIGIDISMRMLKIAKKSYKGYLLVADAENPPFKREVFDTIVAAGSFHYFENPKKIVKIFHRLLRKGGVFLTIVPKVWYLKPFIKTYKKEELLDIFKIYHVEEIKNMSRSYFVKARKLDKKL